MKRRAGIAATPMDDLLDRARGSDGLYPPESVSWSPERRAEVLRTREVLFHGTAQERRMSLEEVEREARRVLVVLRDRRGGVRP